MGDFVVLAACNRTYYGNVGRTYELEIRRPREDRLPFLCHLNFTAAGGELGDLVQVIHTCQEIEQATIHFCIYSFLSFTLILQYNSLSNNYCLQNIFTKSTTSSKINVLLCVEHVNTKYYNSYIAKQDMKRKNN